MADVRRSFSVFINCPFDPSYQPLFDAVVFTVSYCGFEARSALEVVDSGETRLAKIISLIAGSRLSIHDISRVELDSGTNLPRFNMPIELGIAIGMKHRGTRKLRDHHLLVLDGARPELVPERFRYQMFASDLAGTDIRVHGGRVGSVVQSVREFLSVHASIEGAAAIRKALHEFEATLPAMVAAARQDMDALNYVDRLRHISAFIARTKA